MIELLCFYNYCFLVELLYMGWEIFMVSVHALVSVVLAAVRVKVCQHFGLSYAVQTSLQAYSTRKLW
jgi:hypothetical protein